MDRGWNGHDTTPKFAFQEVSFHHRLKVVLLHLLSIHDGAVGMMDLDVSLLWSQTPVLLSVKPLSHQGGVLTATTRRARKTQNTEVRAVGSPRAPRDRRGIAVASPLDAVGSPRTPCHGAHFVHAQIKCAPWLGVPTAIWMSAVGTPRVRSGNAVTAQWGLLERHEDAVCTQRGRTWSPQERRCRRWRLHGDLTECMETSLRLYRVPTARLRRLHCAYIEYHLFLCAPTETTQSCRGDHCDAMALPRSPSAFTGRL